MATCPGRRRRAVGIPTDHEEAMSPFTSLDVRPDIDMAPWEHANVVGELELESIGLLRNGTKSGRATIGFLLKANDGSYLIAQTTWRLFNGAARALAATPIASEETDD